jgi:hypothetical protein
MNVTTPQPEGSISVGDTHLELIAACFPGNAVTAQWACGLPLSFVQEMADLWLAQHDQTTQAHTSFDGTSSFVDPNTGTK